MSVCIEGGVINFSINQGGDLEGGCQVKSGWLDGFDLIRSDAEGAHQFVERGSMAFDVATGSSTDWHVQGVSVRQRCESQGGSVAYFP